jgi:hypothetical protein
MNTQRECRILFLTTVAFAIVAQTPQSTTETFVWKMRGQIIGRLSVPKGPVDLKDKTPRLGRVEVYDYREGIVTTLRYQDGASIVLQTGGMYRLRMFQDPE